MMNRRIILILSSIFILALSISAQDVYKTKTGKKYHTSSCSYLKKTAIKLTLQEAINSDLTPCSRCNPATLKSTDPKETETKKTTTVKTQTTSSQCSATTKKGTRCKRKAKAGSNYCWQHGG
jgi:hypothetical protein